MIKEFVSRLLSFRVCPPILKLHARLAKQLHESLRSDFFLQFLVKRLIADLKSESTAFFLLELYLFDLVSSREITRALDWLHSTDRPCFSPANHPIAFLLFFPELSSTHSVTHWRLSDGFSWYHDTRNELIRHGFEDWNLLRSIQATTFRVSSGK
jgi:hypothetical protein